MMTRVASWAPDLLMCTGACTVSVGVGLMHFPAGLIVGGTFALAAGWLLARGSK